MSIGGGVCVSFGGHRVRLTSAGQALLSQLQVILADLGDALTLTKNVGKGLSGSLSVGYGALALLHPLFLDAIKRFRASHPQVNLSMFELATSDQPKALAAGKIDCGFMHLGPGVAGLSGKRARNSLAHADTVLDWFSIQTCGLGIAVPRAHRLAKRKSVPLPELASEPFIVVSRTAGGVGYGLPAELCRKAGFEPRVVQQVSSITAQLNLVSVEMGIAAVPVGKSYAYPERLAVVPIENLSYPIAFAIGWVRGRRSPVLNQLIDVVAALASPRRGGKANTA